jgi:adenine-specific DNA-methyltransferase
VIRQFGEPIYPGFRLVASLGQGGDKPHHLVVNGENYHVLETLLYAFEGCIDCIYIDPPYNSGARDWKYNNDYVDADDTYRHSKWLAFMERRLTLAKRLLNPDDSILIVAIDEKEYLRLGLLLEQLFPSANIQMVTSVIKPGGTSRTHGFSRVDEYLFFIFLGSAQLVRTGDNMLSEVSEDGEEAATATLSESDLWEGMVRRGIGVVRSQRPKQFYPIYIDEKKHRIVEAGEPLPLDVPRESVTARRGLTAVWPIKDDGTEGFWQLSPAGLEKARARGTVRVGSFNRKTSQWRIQYMKAKKAKAVEDGTVATLGKDENGVVILDMSESALSPESTPRTVWNRSLHDASVGGAGLLNRLLPGRKFPFPKSLYAVEDALRFFVKEKPDALILDFFGGSGTTAHAVFRLNHQDGGRRRCILVTNNEVSETEASALRKSGVQPGDPKWEALGIFHHITMPRVTAAVTGTTPDGTAISGDYKSTDAFPMGDGFEENVQFLELCYLDQNEVSRGKAFEAIAPLLWMKAGAEGAIIAKVHKPFSVPADATYGILFEINRWHEFAEAVRDRQDLSHLFVVTDSQAQYQQVIAELPQTVDVSMLYEDYLRNFEINVGGAR